MMAASMPSQVEVPPPAPPADMRPQPLMAPPKLPPVVQVQPQVHTGGSSYSCPPPPQFSPKVTGTLAQSLEMAAAAPAPVFTVPTVTVPGSVVVCGPPQGVP